MNDSYIIRGKKIVTVSKLGSIDDGAMVIQHGKIADIGKWDSDMFQAYSHLPVYDYTNHIITPSLVDCHTHLLEFAPTSLYPVTAETHFLAGKTILLHALLSGITALGEQICGHPQSIFSIDDYRQIVRGFPMDISFAATSISIGLPELVHFTSVTKSEAVTRQELSDVKIVTTMAKQNDYPGENIFINATPANFTPNEVPRAGEIIYSFEELRMIVEIFHEYQQKIGVHVAGEKEIKLAIDAGVDVLHHAHGITDELMTDVFEKGVKVVATPLGGTHQEPNSPQSILKLVQNNIHVSIATDAYLPPFQNVDWLPFKDQTLQGPDALMPIAHPAMLLMKAHGYNENEILALLTANPADILGKGSHFGKLLPGMDANFIVTKGIPGLEITNVSDIKQVYFRGKKVVDRAGY